MMFLRPRNAVTHMVDVYCCRNPFCRTRMHAVKAGHKPATHCGIEMCFIGTIEQQRWDRMSAETFYKVRAAEDAGRKLRRIERVA